MSPARFAQVMGAGADDVLLDEAAIAISATLQPGIDELEWLTAIDLIAGDCPTPTPAGICRYLVDGVGFTGNRAAYNDWRNSCIDQVISRRTGIPITLSILMIEVGRRLGVDLVGVSMPSHFIVGVSTDTDCFFDPFNSSASLDRAGAQRLYVSIAGRGASWSDEFLTPTSNRRIVIRMLNNLVSIFSQRHDVVRLALVMQLRAQLPELADAEAQAIASATAVFN